MKPLKHILINDILNDLKKNLETRDSFIKFEFKMPMIKFSPISDNSFPLYYNCWFQGQIVNDEFKFYQGVKVQYASYCPCSAELSKDLKENKGCVIQGFPHAQRSFASVTIESQPNTYMWLEDIVSMVENSIATIPYPIIKRVDEQEIARVASNNPIFVEDAIRQISKTLNEVNEIKDWWVKCVHEESIHTHEAISINYKGIKDGFDGKNSLF
jgi:GTP cyclohydrolase I